MLLSDRQVEHVELRILESGLRNHQLHLDLIDHICCSIEELMDDGLSFELAMPKVFQTYSHRYLRKIEYTTKILTTDAMKKHTKIIGIIGILFVITGSTFKLLHLPGASTTLALGVIVLGLGFFGSNTIDTVRNLEGTKGKIVQVIGALGALITLAGGMFKLLHLPGASALIMTGPVLLLLYFSFSSYLRTRTIE